MALVAGDVIDTARDRHATFDPQRHPDRMLLRCLSDYSRQLHGRIARIDPDALRVELDTPLPLADHEAGIALPAHRSIEEVTAKDPATANPQRLYPVELIPAAQRADRGAPLAAAWEVNGVLYLRSPADVWRYMGSVAVAYVPLPIELVNLKSVLAVPDAAQLACIEYVAAFMARRQLPGGPDPAGLVTVAADVERQYLEDVANGVAGRTFLTRDVYP